MNNPGQGVAPKNAAPNTESVREFISMAVHDLRAPLRALRLGSRLLLADGRDAMGENATTGAKYLEDGIERLETLIRDIADCCYEEVRELDASETDLESVLIEVQRGLAAELKNSGATVTHDPLPRVAGNPASLEAVFRCLIGNACKFRSEAPLRIHVGAVREASEWMVSIRDNGVGFDPAYRERVFRPFERLNGKQYPGSGLGLSLAKRVIERHGGHIWADSQPGLGSTIYFSLLAAGE